MHPPIHSAFHLEAAVNWLAMIGFGIYHGLNPGMGWLFALSRGLQLQSERAVWSSLFPIALGHGAAITLVAALVVTAGHLLDPEALRVGTASVLLVFGVYKLFRYYRHPVWVGMQVGMRDLFFWSFLMATAHGAGLMIAPILLALTRPTGEELAAGEGVGAAVMGLAVILHTAAMLGVMGLVAWVVYRKLGLAVLRKGWLNFDLLWAGALLVVGVYALYGALRGTGH